MEKVYLLLRNNLQTGPYTFAQLQQQVLQPSDLIWIEGESIAWQEPSSIQKSQANEKNLLKRVSNTQLRSALHHPSFIARNASEPYFDSSPPEIDLIIHKRHGKTVSLAQLLTVALLTAGAAAAWSFDFSLVPVQQDVISYAAAPVVFNPAPPPAKAVITVEDSAVRKRNEAPNTAIQPQAKPALKHKEAKAKSVIKKQDTAQTVKAVESKTQNVNLTTPIQSPPSEVKKDSLEKQVHQAEEKKTLGRALRNLFKKKRNKQQENSKTEE